MSFDINQRLPEASGFKNNLRDTIKNLQNSSSSSSSSSLSSTISLTNINNIFACKTQLEEATTTNNIELILQVLFALNYIRQKIVNIETFDKIYEHRAALFIKSLN